MNGLKLLRVKWVKCDNKLRWVMKMDVKSEKRDRKKKLNFENM
jgi:hypothetical protein